MHILGWILAVIAIVVVAIIVLGVIIGIIEHNRDRRVVKDRYEWLELCSLEKWKTSTELLREMRQLKSTERNLIITFYNDVEVLEKERLIMSRKTEIKTPYSPYPITKIEYLRSPWGSRRRRKREKKELTAPDHLKPA